MSSYEWTCSMCTFKNPSSSTHCSMCNDKNPNANNVVDSHIELSSANHGNHQKSNTRSNILAHMKTKSVVWLASVRDQTALDGKHNPAKHLCCLYVIVSMVILGCILLVSAVERNIMNLSVSMPDDEGTFIWSFGWFKATFYGLDDATCNVCPYDGLEASEMPISASIVYAENAGDLLIISLGIILIWIVLILYILCERSNSHEPLFIKCKCFKIPQRATVYHAFSVINTFILVLMLYYIMVAIYGYIEADFYLTGNIPDCTKESGCWLYPYPHYGYCVLVIMFFSIMLFAYAKAEGLDDKLSIKTLNEYYPENEQKAIKAGETFAFDRLLASFGVVKRICIISFIMCYSFQEVGMVTILFRQDTATSYNQYIEFQGLTNRNGVIPNFYVSSLSANNATNSTTMGDIGELNSNQWEEEASAFSSIASSWDGWLAFITGISMIIAVYLVFVVERYSSNKCMRFIIIGVTFVELLGHTGFMAMYYYEWANFFGADAKSVLESELFDLTGETFNISWFPDWGALIAVILWFYLGKLMYLEWKGL